MPSDLFTLHLPDEASTPVAVQLQPLDPKFTDELAEAYFHAYPPGIACDTPVEAVQEISDTFAGEYGVLRQDASAMAIREGRVAGAVLVVERSIWDPALEGPFIIDLFIDPDAQGAGLGRALMTRAISQCVAVGDEQLSLRVGEGTSPAAHALYRSLGFVSS